MDQARERERRAVAWYLLTTRRGGGVTAVAWTPAEVAAYWSATYPELCQRGAEWRGTCPLHRGRRDSFAVNSETGMWCCPSECGRGGSMVDFEMKRTGCSFPDALKAAREIVGQRATKAAAGPAVVVARDEYCDENGAPLFRVCRTDPKGFFQQRYENGEWKNGVRGTRLVPYRLPELLKAGELFICEGEKDVNLLASWKLAATTNPGGAGKWKVEYSEFLRGKRTVVIPDDDTPGKQHALTIASPLLGVAAEVRIVELVGAKDVAEWAEKNGTKETLIRLAGEAKGLTKTTLAALGARWFPSATASDGQETTLASLAALPRIADVRSTHKTDLGNSELLASWHGDELRYCSVWGKWLVWNGTRWCIDDTGAVYRMAAETVRELYALAGKIDDQDERKRIAIHAFKCESKARLDAMVALAATNAALVIQPDALDQDGMLLNVENGTLDLRTGELRPHRREDFITKLVPTAYNRGANCSQWLRFLHRLFERDQQLINFVHRAVGYSLTSSVSEQCLFLLHGDGANGKSTLIETVLHLLGDYALMTPSDTLLAKRYDGIPNDIARLTGRRFVAAIETDENRRLAESRIKGLTGGDTITARFMRGEWFDFQPEFKIWLATNHLPSVRGSDLAMWRRIRLIPFHYTFSEKETGPDFLKSLIATELPGILRWSVMGCLAWRKARLKPPEQVTNATEEYRAGENQVARFIDECCVTADRCEALARPLYQAYRAWSANAGEDVLTEKAFAQRMPRCGFAKRRKTRGWTYEGIGLRPEAATMY